MTVRWLLQLFPYLNFLYILTNLFTVTFAICIEMNRTGVSKNYFGFGIKYSMVKYWHAHSNIFSLFIVSLIKDTYCVIGYGIIPLIIFCLVNGVKWIMEIKVYEEAAAPTLSYHCADSFSVFAVFMSLVVQSFDIIEYWISNLICNLKAGFVLTYASRICINNAPSILGQSPLSKLHHGSRK